MAITLDGNLGITTPAETVQGALTTTGNTILGDASTDTLNVGNGGLVKDASGNVGIGTASPTAKLSVTAGSSNLDLGLLTTVASKIEQTTGDLYIRVSSSNSDTLLQTNRNITFGTGASYTEQARIDSAGLFKFNSGYGSVATAYGCRAWVNFNGTGTVAIRASGNVSSITDNAVGNYRINFTTAIVDANYCPTGTAEDVTSGSFVTGDAATVPTTSGFTFYVITSAGATNDAVRVNVGIFR